MKKKAGYNMNMSINQNKSTTNPSIAEYTSNILEVIDLIKLGYTSLPSIRSAVKKRGWGWSEGKVERYYRGALDIIQKEAKIQETSDPRLLLVYQAEKVATSEWEAINELREIRARAHAKLVSGLRLEDLSLQEQQAAAVEYKDLANIESRAKMVILKSQERISELYGFKQDKTVLIQHKKDAQLQYIDKMNDDLRVKFRDVKALPDVTEDNESIVDDVIIDIITDEVEEEVEGL